MLSKLFPPSIDNDYRGQKLALWLFGVVVTMRTMQSLMIIFNGRFTVRSADGVPLETYPAAAAQTIVALFAISSLARLLLSLICVVVLVRYRRAVPFMCAVIALNYLAANVMARFVPIVRTGRPLGPVVNLVLFGMTIAALALSLWQTRPPTATSISAPPLS